MKKGILLMFLLLSLLNVHGQVWKPYGAGFIAPNVIHELIIYNNELYACGGITGSGTTIIDNVSRWDGVQWNALGTSNIYAGPKCMEIFDGDLVVAGYQSGQGTVPNTRGIARWDGTQWHPLASGITSGTIHAMAVYNGSLYVGGNTTKIDSMNIRDIAKWDGTKWDTVCTLSLGLSELLAMEVFNSELYIGGYFYTVNGVPMSNIAKFDGTSWSTVGGGLNGDVRDFYTDTINNRLYAVGSFTSANGGTVSCPSNVAYWNGNNWYAIGPNGPGLVPSVVYMHKNEVYIGNNIGLRFNLNGDTLAGIAKWNGSDWMPLDRGVWNNSVYSTVFGMVTFDDDLAVCGGFTTAGSISANLIAAWGDTLTSIPQPTNVEDAVSIFPNPFSNAATIVLNDDLQFKLPLTFNLYQIDGKLVFESIVESMEFEFYDTNLKAGTYTYSLHDKFQQQVAAGKFSIK